MNGAQYDALRAAADKWLRERGPNPDWPVYEEMAQKITAASDAIAYTKYTPLQLQIFNETVVDILKERK